MTRLLPITLILLLATVSGFACSQPPGYGFIIHSVFIDETKFFAVTTNQTNQTLGGTFVADLSGAQGSNSSFSGQTDGNGLLSELGKRTPATWDIQDVNGYCSQYDFHHPSSLPDYEVLNLYPSSSPQQHTCYRFGADYSVSAPSGVAQNNWVTVTLTYSSGSLADVDSGSSAPNETPSSSDWSSFYYYDIYGNYDGQGTPTIIDSTDVTCTFYTYAGGSGTPYVIQMFDSTNTPYGLVQFTLP